MSLTDKYLEYISAIHRYSPRTTEIYSDVLKDFTEFAKGGDGSQGNMTDEEAEEYHEMMGDEMPWERITIEVEVELENQTNEEKEVDMALMYLETKGTSNGFALGADRASEGRYGATREELQPGETKKLVYPYDMSSIWFTKKEWKEIKSREFYLTISSYPEKKMLKLF